MNPEQELEDYRQIHRALTKDPEIRKEWQKVLKKAVPNAITPDIDAEEQLNKRFRAELDERDKKIAALEEARLNAEVEGRLKAQRDRLTAPPWNFDAEDIAEVEKLIKEKGFHDYDLAAEYYRKTITPSTPSGLGISGVSRPSKSKKQRMAEFNNSFKNVFRRPDNSKTQAMYDDAFERIRTGEYLKE